MIKNLITKVILPSQKSFTIANHFKFCEVVNGFTEAQFVQNASHYIQEWTEKLEEYEGDIIDEIELTDGVLKVKIDDFNVFVINRQLPNRQIWYSSPVSGPARFDFEQKSQEWQNKDKKELYDFLFAEITQITEK